MCVGEKYKRGTGKIDNFSTQHRGTGHYLKRLNILHGLMDIRELPLLREKVYVRIITNVDMWITIHL